MLNIKINTEILQKLIKKVSRTIKPNKLIPITGYIQLYTEDNLLKLKTTTFDVLCIFEESEVEIINTGSLYIDADKFIKLVNKTSSPLITIKENEKSISIKGNGLYKFEKTDSTFNNFPVPELKNPLQLDLTMFNEQMKIGSKMASKDLNLNYITGIMIKDCTILSTDNLKACRLRNDLLNIDNSLLFPPLFINFLSNALIGNTINLYYDESNRLITATDGANTKIISYELQDKESFPKINDLFDSLNKSTHIELNSTIFQEALDRCITLLNPLKSTITLHFTKEYINIIDDNFDELIKINNDVPKDFEYTAVLDNKSLLSIINLFNDDIKISLRNPNIIYFKYNDLEIILTTQE